MSKSEPKLFDRVRNLIELGHMSRNSANTDTCWIQRFIILHNKRHFSQHGAEDSSAFLSSPDRHQLLAAIQTPDSIHQRHEGALK